MDIISAVTVIVGLTVLVVAVLFVLAFVVGGLRARSIQRAYVFQVAHNVEAKAAFDKLNGNR